MPNKPIIIKGGIHRDERGQLIFFNNFDMSGIKRFYIITTWSNDSNSSEKTNNFQFPVSGSHFPLLRQTQKSVITHQAVRAWQGHKIEKKYFYVNGGSFLIAAVKIDNWQNPSPGLKPHVYKLTVHKPQILYVPPGYANGIKPLEQSSMLTVYSNLTLEESKKDDYRFDTSLWFDWEKTNKPEATD